MKLYSLLLTILIIIGQSTVSFGFNARVASIPDGDTIEVYKEGERFRITVDLYGIDCPEKQQYFGREARNAMVTLIASRKVWIDAVSEDQSGHLSAVISAEGKNINEALVSNGWAWVVPDECNKKFCVDWRRLEEEARKKRIGLWSASKPQPPWEWRTKGKRNFFYMLPDQQTPVWRHAP